MPERIVGNLGDIAKWREEIALALIFWFIGATIGIGQHLLSPTPFSWRIVIGRALSTGGLAVVAGTVLVMHPTMSPLAQMGIAAGIATLGTTALEAVFLRYILGRRSPDA